MRLLPLIILLAGNASFARASVAPQTPQEEGWATIKTNEGMLFVWNVKNSHFTLTLKGKDIKSIDDPEHIFFDVDGMIFQIQMASISEFAKDAKEKRLDDRAVLAAHRDWETKFLEELLKSKLSVRTFNVKLSNGSDASLWQYDMPSGANVEATKQVYLTAVNQDYVLLLNVAVTNTISDEASRKYLLDTMATLRRSTDTINIQKLADSIRAGAKP
jgi:hypothetical protein